MAESDGWRHYIDDVPKAVVEACTGSTYVWYEGEVVATEPIHTVVDHETNIDIGTPAMSSDAAGHVLALAQKP